LFDSPGRMHEDFSLPITSWLALLSIAHRCNFPDVRSRAVREIYGTAETAEEHQNPQQDHVLLISVAEKHAVPPERVIPSLAEIVKRSEPLNEDEIVHFSALTMSRIARARHALAETKTCQCFWRSLNLNMFPPKHRYTAPGTQSGYVPVFWCSIGSLRIFSEHSEWSMKF
jgi:hypothetical protein